MADERRFVKSGDTRATVASSRNELERMLRRYGCGSLAVSQDYQTGRIIVRFTVADEPGNKGPQIPVELHVEIASVYRRLFGRPYPAKPEDRGADAARAERVAWRHLVLWVDAALAAADAGLQRISDAFFAHTLIRDERGNVGRVVDLFSAAAPGGNWKRLLPGASEG
jgi:hypothetical protein